MKATKRKTLCFLFLLTVPFLCLSSVPAGAQSTLQTVTLPAGCPIPWQMELAGDGAIWFSGPSGSKGYLARVDTQTVLSDPNGATQWWEVAPQYHAITGSAYAQASVGVAIGGGYVWSGGQYSGADEWSTELLSRFNPSTLEVKYYWLPKEAKGIRSIRYDPAGYIWIAASRILRFKVSDESLTVCTIAMGTCDLLLDGDYLWATASGFGGSIRKMDVNTFALTTYTPSSNPCLMTKDSGGNIWFSMNRAHKIGKLVSGSGVITEYSTSLTEDGPCGLVFDSDGWLWVAGYANKKMLKVDPNTGLEMESHTRTDWSYYPIRGAPRTVWCWGRGSVALTQIKPSLIPPPPPTVLKATVIECRVPARICVGSSLILYGILRDVDGVRLLSKEILVSWYPAEGGRTAELGRTKTDSNGFFMLPWTLDGWTFTWVYVGPGKYCVAIRFLGDSEYKATNLMFEIYVGTDVSWDPWIL